MTFLSVPDGALCVCWCAVCLCMLSVCYLYGVWLTVFSGSGVTSEYMEADRHYCDDRDSFCASPATASSSVLDRSLLDPGALSGLRVAVAGHGVGIVLGFERKKFRSTRFRVLFDDGKVKLLKLKRSAKKGVVPFTLLEAQQSGAQDNENGENFAEESVKSFRG